MSLLNRTTKFFSPDDAGGLDVRPTINSAQDILKLMDEDEPENEDIIDLSKRNADKDTSSKDSKDDEGENDKKEAINVKDEDDEDKEDDEKDKKDELDELEEELEDEDELKLEGDEDELEFVPMPRRKEILAKYPKFFEEFPGVERAYFRDQKFSEYFPTPADAEKAFEKAKTLDGFEEDLLRSGNTTNILKLVKEENQESYNKIIDNYLPSLRQLDEKAYFHVVGTIIKGTVYNMVKEARDSSDETLQEAARILNKFVFNTEKWTPAERLAKSDTDKKDPREEELTRRQQEFDQRQFQTAFNGVQSKVKAIFEKTIEKNIDPKNSMTPYVRKNAIRDAHEEIDKLLSADTRFKAVLTKAWEKAKESNYSDESLETVMKVVKSRASSLMGQVIKKARITALKGSGIRTKEKLDDKEENDSNNSGNSTSSSNRGPLKRDRDRRETSGSNADKSENDKIRKMGARDYIMAD